MNQKRPLSPMEFLVQTVLPILFERLDEAFPEFGWRRTSRGWRASKPRFIKDRFGVTPRQVEANFPTGFMIDGTRFVSWPAYVDNATPPDDQNLIQVIGQLAEKAGVKDDLLDGELTPEDETNRRRANLLETFMAQAQAALWTDAGKAARAYLIGQRGFTKTQLSDPFFGLYTTNSQVRDRLLKADFTLNEIEDLGLLADERWDNRLVFPWRNRWGRIQTIAGRDLTNSADPKTKFLYLAGGNRPPAFGLHRALRSEAGRWDVVLVQGLIEVVYFHTHGFPNAAAIGGDGKMFTAKRWEALVGYGVRCVTLAMDTDAAGRDGLIAALDHLRQVDNPPSVFVVDPDDLAPAHDAGELVRQSGNLKTFRKILDHRKSAAVYRGQALLRGIEPGSPAHHRRVAVDKILDYAATLKHPEAALDREDLFRIAAQATGYHRHTLSSMAQEPARKTRRRRAESETERVVASWHKLPPAARTSMLSLIDQLARP